ncbi:MAG: response regulator [Deltaproteobacteria bacterium]|nr:response regulator [Deltaproteobacteria bacterium]
MSPSLPHILIADDEPELCDVLKKVLCKEGYRVLTATTGEKALALLKKERVRLLLLDLKMPGINGLEVLKEIHQGFTKPAPQVVILTAHSGLSSAREAMELGATDYLTKPFDLDEVKAVVKEVLG